MVSILRSFAAAAIVLACVSASDTNQADVVVGIGARPSARRFIEVAGSALADRGMLGISFAYDTTGDLDDPETEAIRGG